jgi:hypothetical protein
MGGKTLSESYPTLILLGGGSLQSRYHLPIARIALNFCHGKTLHPLYERSPPLSTVIRIQVESIGIERPSNNKL